MEEHKTTQDTFNFYRSCDKEPLSNELIILIPIAKELCPKIAEKFVTHSSFTYALQGALIVEIRRRKQELSDYKQAFSALHKSFQMELSEISNARLKRLFETLEKRYG